MAVLARQKQRGEPSIVDAVHETECIEKHLHNVVVAVPCRLVQCRVAELHAKSVHCNSPSVNIVMQKILTAQTFLLTWSLTKRAPRPSSRLTSFVLPLLAAAIKFSARLMLGVRNISLQSKATRMYGCWRNKCTVVWCEIYLCLWCHRGNPPGRYHIAILHTLAASAFVSSS